MAREINLSLVHFNSPALGENWSHLFKDEPNVNIIEGDIFNVKTDAIVSPGNSFGFMDGGLDLLISKKLGWEVQSELIKKIDTTALGELLVGQALSIEVNNKIVICAPTMRVPTSEGIPHSVNAYLAMKAILIEGIRNEKITSIAIPGLCTGTGRMPPNIAAKQMKAAFDEIINNKKPEFPLYLDAIKHHKNLTKEWL